MIKLWGRANSSNVMKVIWTLEELRLPYDRIDVGGPFGGTATPEYRAMNPLGVVPSLEDGGFRLFESNAIIRYICNAYAPHTPLYPAAAQQRATVESWMEFQQTALNRPMSTVFQGLIRTAAENRDMHAITLGAAEAAKIWAILDDRLSRQAFLAGAHLTLADVTYGPHIHRWLNIDSIPNRPACPNLDAWYQRMMDMPAYRQHVAIPIT